MCAIYRQEHGLSPTPGEVSPLFEVSDCGVIRSGTEAKVFESADYIFVYIRNGSGELAANNRTMSLYSGDLMICRPNEARFFVSDPDDVAEYYWASFRGRFSADILTSLKLTSKEKYFVGHDGELNAALEKMIDERERNEPNSPIITASMFIAILGNMSRLSVHILPQDQSKGYEKIAPALNAINSDCTSKISVDEYAKMCNLSTSYFTHLFTKITGFSPMEYKQLQRINIAKNLLSTTNLSVKEISTVIGFKDPLYFGRCFKQATGQTPSSYRARK